MINFFRKIRKQLADDNKPLKYMRYAIGEIVLVVVGILIALAINNWNEERKSDNQIKILLDNLVKSIEEDRNYLNRTAILHEFRSNSLSHLYKTALNTNEPYSPMKPIAKLDNNSIWKGSYPDTLNVDFANLTMNYSGIHNDVVINKNILDELKNTGLFSALNSDSLKESINTYYSFVNSKFLIDDWNKGLSISWRKFLRDNHGVLTMELFNNANPYDFVGDNKSVQIRIHEMIGPARFRSDNASKAIILAKDVLSEIDKYQNSK